MEERGSAAAFLPERLSLAALREAARGCTACPLWRDRGQALQMGAAREAADPSEKPNWREIAACRPWVEAELAVVAPRVLVCLGATAAQALLGRDVRVTRDRGRPLDSELAPVAFATVHPSSILRAPDEKSRRRERALFVGDLEVAARALA